MLQYKAWGKWSCFFYLSYRKQCIQFWANHYSKSRCQVSNSHVIPLFKYSNIVFSVSSDTKLIVPFVFPRSTLLWLHTTFAFLYLLLTVYSMRRHTSKMHYREDDLVGGMVSHSLHTPLLYLYVGIKPPHAFTKAYPTACTGMNVVDNSLSSSPFRWNALYLSMESRNTRRRST